jgi:hypothetical protein
MNEATGRPANTLYANTAVAELAEVDGVSWDGYWALHVAYFIAVNSEPNREEGRRVWFRADVDQFNWLMRLDSDAPDCILSALRSACCISANVRQREHGWTGRTTHWGSLPLLSGFSQLDGDSIDFAVPRDMLAYVMAQGNPPRLVLPFMPALKLKYARATYEHVVPYAMAGATGWIPLDVVRSWAGKSGISVAPGDFFLRNALRPAVHQIDKVSDFELSLDVGSGNGGTPAADSVQFFLKRKSSEGRDWDSLISANEAYNILRNDFGLKGKQFRIASKVMRETGSSGRRDVRAETLMRGMRESAGSNAGGGLSNSRNATALSPGVNVKPAGSREMPTAALYCLSRDIA